MMTLTAEMFLLKKIYTTKLKTMNQSDAETEAQETFLADSALKHISPLVLRLPFPKGQKNRKTERYFWLIYLQKQWI